MPNHLKVIMTVLVYWFYAGFVHSAEVELPAEILNIVGDPEYGEYLASDCKTCHKVEGSAPGVPSIIGVSKRDLIIALHAYKQKVRKNPVMQMIAGRLDNNQIGSLAIYFSKLDPPK